VSYSRNKTYSTKTRSKDDVKLTTKGYVIFIENRESTKKYSRPAKSSYFDIEGGSTYFDIEGGSEYYGTE
jgi:hypothetical protein